MCFASVDCFYAFVYRRQPETTADMSGGCLSGHGDQNSLRAKRTLLGTTRRVRHVAAILAARLWKDRYCNVSILFPFIVSQMISRYLSFRYGIVRDTKPDLTTPGRYVLGNKGHFQGLVVHSDGTVLMTTNHRTADNVAISPQRLMHMQVEAVFRLVPQGCAERLTEGSGGSHLSAGAASAGDSCDARGGGSCLLPELLNFLPSYYFCLKHLSTLAACSRSMKIQVLNKHHWKECHLDLEVSELLQDREALGVLSRWWENARTINMSQHQLTQLSGIPRNCLLRWRVFEWPSPDQQSSGYRAVHSLLGCARFQLHVPDHVRTLKIGVENPRGPEAVWINIHELFTERMCYNFGLVPSQRRLASRSVPLRDGILRPRSPNYVMLIWDRHYFAIQLNGHNLGPLQLNVDTAPGPSSQGLPFLWAVSAKRAQHNEEVQILPLLSPVMPGAECVCRICQRSHTLETHACAVCPICYAWVCREHAEQAPHAECPGCTATLGDFIGGAQNAAQSDHSEAVLAVACTKLDIYVFNKILCFYNAASQGPPAHRATSRQCLACSRIRNIIVAYCVSQPPADYFWAESISHSLNNCCTFTANRWLRQPEPIRILEIGFVHHEHVTWISEIDYIVVFTRL